MKNSIPEASDNRQERARALHRKAQAKYQKTEKGKATWTRWNRSEKGLEACKRYNDSPEGKLVRAFNTRRPERKLHTRLLAQERRRG